KPCPEARLGQETRAVPAKESGVLREHHAAALPLLDKNPVCTREKAFGSGDFFEGKKDGNLGHVARQLSGGRRSESRVVQERLHRVFLHERDQGLVGRQRPASPTGPSFSSPCDEDPGKAFEGGFRSGERRFGHARPELARRRLKSRLSKNLSLGVGEHHAGSHIASASPAALSSSSSNPEKKWSAPGTTRNVQPRATAMSRARVTELNSSSPP